jgi:hypothetical protein
MINRERGERRERERGERRSRSLGALRREGSRGEREV